MATAAEVGLDAAEAWPPVGAGPLVVMRGKAAVSKIGKGSLAQKMLKAPDDALLDLMNSVRAADWERDGVRLAKELADEVPLDLLNRMMGRVRDVFGKFGDQITEGNRVALQQVADWMYSAANVHTGGGPIVSGVVRGTARAMPMELGSTAINDFVDFLKNRRNYTAVREYVLKHRLTAEDIDAASTAFAEAIPDKAVPKWLDSLMDDLAQLAEEVAPPGAMR